MPETAASTLTDGLAPPVGPKHHPLASLERGSTPGMTQGLLPFRMRQISGKVLLTTDFGDWMFASNQELRDLYAGNPAPEFRQRLSQHNFLRESADLTALVERTRIRKQFLNAGPILHILVITLRCNETCVYCHASRADMTRTDTDMSREHVEKAIELSLQSTAKRITIEFQGGEPLAHFPMVQHAIKVAKQRNKAYGKEIEFTMVSNLSLMTEEKLDYLIDQRVQICTSIDGPEKLHNKQRVLAGGNAFRESARWIKRINERYEAQGLDPVLYHVEALLTATRASLDFPREIVDTYVGLGCKTLFLRPVDPFGFAGKTHATIEYERRRYQEFYRTAVDYILELNQRGTQVLERFASIFLTKILTGEDPNFLDIRNPIGAGTGCLTYNHDGNIYASDEGRMLAASGDETFKLGHVDTSRYRELVTHEGVRSLLLASNLDAQPDCVTCTYNPYCGMKPEQAYVTQGSIHGRMRENSICAVHKGIQDYLFGKLALDDAKVNETFRRWTTVRERSHFVQVGATAS